MSDLFKDHGPELSDDEDRRLWQRVRAIPGEAAGEAPGRAPWWRALWAMPAVRYGAPAFAVLLVAVVWVAERRPEPPPRVAATRAQNELDQEAAAPPVSENAPLPMAQAPPAASRVLTKERRGAEGGRPATAQLSKDEPARRVDGGAVLEREVTLKAAPTPAPAAEEAPKFAPAPAREEVAAQSGAPAPANWGAMKSQGRDSGRASAQAMASHALVAEVADIQALGPLTATVTALPGDLGLPAGESIALVLTPDAGALVSFVHAVHAPGIPYGSAPARVQAAALAALLERALLDPAGAPRARLEALEAAALKIDPREGGQGRARLLGAIDGALGAAPAR